MTTSEWTDARLDDSFQALRSDIREMRAEMREMRADMRTMHTELRADTRQLWVTMVAGYAAMAVALIGAVLATHL